MGYAMDRLTPTLRTLDSKTIDSTEVPSRACTLRSPLVLDDIGVVYDVGALQITSHVGLRVSNPDGLEERHTAAFSGKAWVTAIGAQGGGERVHHECSSHRHSPNLFRAYGNRSLHRGYATVGHRFLAFADSPPRFLGLVVRDCRAN